MKTNALIQSALILHKNEIRLADENPDQWYELFVYHQDTGSESIESGDTFKEVCKHLRKCINEHEMKSVGIDIWHNQADPRPMCTCLIPDNPVVMYDEAYGHHLELVFWDISPHEEPEEVPENVREQIFDQLASCNLSGTFDTYQYNDKVLGGTVSYTGTWRVYHPENTVQETLKTIRSDLSASIANSLSFTGDKFEKTEQDCESYCAGIFSKAHSIIGEAIIDQIFVKNGEIAISTTNFNTGERNNYNLANLTADSLLVLSQELQNRKSKSNET